MFISISMLFSTSYLIDTYPHLACETPVEYGERFPKRGLLYRTVNCKPYFHHSNLIQATPQGVLREALMASASKFASLGVMQHHILVWSASSPTFSKPGLCCRSSLRMSVTLTIPSRLLFVVSIVQPTQLALPMSVSM